MDEHNCGKMYAVPFREDNKTKICIILAAGPEEARADAAKLIGDGVEWLIPKSSLPPLQSVIHDGAGTDLKLYIAEQEVAAEA